MTHSTSTSVTLTQDDLHAAASEGLITASQADALWQRWCLPEWQHKSDSKTIAAGPVYRFTNVLYYFGGMVAIGTKSLFMTWALSAWERVACWQSEWRTLLPA